MTCPRPRAARSSRPTWPAPPTWTWRCSARSGARQNSRNRSSPNRRPYTASIACDQAPPCVITVTDTGVGIPVESIPFLFNRFYRVETHHSSEIKGTGLGLSIVKRAVEAHDGAITVSSIPHRETVFTITIPLKRFREEKRIRQLSQVSIETSANKST